VLFTYVTLVEEVIGWSPAGIYPITYVLANSDRWDGVCLLYKFSDYESL